MMNKKEQAAFDDAKNKLAAAYALSWPIDPKPSLVTQEEIRRICDETGKMFVGWWINKHRLLSLSGDYIGQGCSNGTCHSIWRTDRTDSQDCGCFYLTKKDALLALRWQACEMFANSLAKLDALRAEEVAQNRFSL